MTTAGQQEPRPDGPPTDPAEIGASPRVARWLGGGRWGLLIALTTQLLCLVLSGWLVVIRVGSDLPRRVVEAFALGGLPPGETLATPIDWGRLIGFAMVAGVAALVVAIGAFSAFSLARSNWRGTRDRPLWTVRLATTACGALAVVEACGLVLAVNSLRQWSSETVGLTDRWQSTAVLAAGTVSAALGFAIGVTRVRRGARRIGRRAGAAIIAVGILMATGVGVDQIAAHSSYAYLDSLVTAGGGGGDVLSTPVSQGFRTLSFHQVPATRVLYFVACDHRGDCTAFGDGAWRSPFVTYLNAVVTVDGGKSWQSYLYSNAFSLPLGRPACADGVCMLVTATDRPVASSGSSFVALSTDDPQHPLISGTNPPNAGAMSCPSATWCAMAGTSSFAITSDQGATWTTARVPVPHRMYIDAQLLACPSIGHCVVALESTDPRTRAASVMSTDDGGRSWTSSPIDPAYSEVTGLACPDESRCWISVGSSAGHRSGVILLSSDDGGTTWRNNSVVQPSTSSTADSTGLACWSENGCTVEFVEHGKDEEFTTTDGGRTWRSESSPPLRSIACTGSGACMGVGGPATLYVKSSPVADWRRVAMPAPQLSNVTILPR